jgi:hypothetical protein
MGGRFPRIGSANFANRHQSVKQIEFHAEMGSGPNLVSPCTTIYRHSAPHGADTLRAGYPRLAPGEVFITLGLDCALTDPVAMEFVEDVGPR